MRLHVRKKKMVWGSTLRKEPHAGNFELKKCTYTLFLGWDEPFLFYLLIYYSWPLPFSVACQPFMYELYGLHLHQIY